MKSKFCEELRGSYRNRLYDEEINVLPEFDAYFMPSKAKTRLPPWKINVRDIATLLKEIPMVPEMNGKLRMPSYFPSVRAYETKEIEDLLENLDVFRNDTTKFKGV